MLITKRKPPTLGEILVEEFMQPIELTQGEALNAPKKVLVPTPDVVLVTARLTGTERDNGAKSEKKSGSRCRPRG